MKTNPLLNLQLHMHIILAGDFDELASPMLMLLQCQGLTMPSNPKLIQHHGVHGSESRSDDKNITSSLAPQMTQPAGPPTVSRIASMGAPQPPLQVKHSQSKCLFMSLCNNCKACQSMLCCAVKTVFIVCNTATIKLNHGTLA